MHFQNELLRVLILLVDTANFQSKQQNLKQANLKLAVDRHMLRRFLAPSPKRIPSGHNAGGGAGPRAKSALRDLERVGLVRESRGAR